jgi:hypothetical protein
LSGYWGQIIGPSNIIVSPANIVRHLNASGDSFFWVGSPEIGTRTPDVMSILPLDFIPDTAGDRTAHLIWSSTYDFGVVTFDATMSIEYAGEQVGSFKIPYNESGTGHIWVEVWVIALSSTTAKLAWIASYGDAPDDVLPRVAGTDFAHVGGNAVNGITIGIHCLTLNVSGERELMILTVDRPAG